MGLLNILVSLLRQKPVVLMDYIDTLPNGSSKEEFIPCIGLTLCYGMISSSQNVTLTIWQGVNDRSGVLTYRLPEPFSIVAGVAKSIEVPIVGKFIKATIANSSGFSASIEALFLCRGVQ